MSFAITGGRLVFVYNCVGDKKGPFKKNILFWIFTVASCREGYVETQREAKSNFEKHISNNVFSTSMYLFLKRCFF